MIDALSAAVIGLAAAAPLVWGFLDYRRCDDPPLAWLVHKYNQLMSRIIWRCEISGPLPVEPGQGAVIVCNHRSGIDPGFIALTTPRRVHWMVAREYCEAPVIGPALVSLGVIPVGRGGVDTKATKTAIRYAQRGELVGLFPEGRINDTDQFLLPGRPGAAMIALKARAPVIPCYVENSPYDGTTLGSLLMTAHARLTVGEPIDLSPYYGRNEKETLQEVTRLLLREIARLGGRPDFEPRLAGRRWKPEVNDRRSA